MQTIRVKQFSDLSIGDSFITLSPKDHFLGDFLAASPVSTSALVKKKIGDELAVDLDDGEEFELPPEVLVIDVWL